MAKYFKSDISGKDFPLDQLIRANTVAHSILSLIQKEHPQFNKHSKLSFTELNVFRQKYIETYLGETQSKTPGGKKALISPRKKRALITEEIADEKTQPLTFGQRLADNVAKFGGSWRFIILFGIFLALWMTLNSLILRSQAYDPFPFILLNLILSTIAALQAPVIMMSQNRQEEKDRETAKKDYMINLTSELEIRMLHDKFDQMFLHQQEELVELQQIQMNMMREILLKVQKTGATKT